MQDDHCFAVQIIVADIVVVNGDFQNVTRKHGQKLPVAEFTR